MSISNNHPRGGIETCSTAGESGGGGGGDVKCVSADVSKLLPRPASGPAPKKRDRGFDAFHTSLSNASVLHTSGLHCAFSQQFLWIVISAQEPGSVSSLLSSSLPAPLIPSSPGLSSATTTSYLPIFVHVHAAFQGCPLDTPVQIHPYLF